MQQANKLEQDQTCW